MGDDRVSSGIEGLDEMLNGGFPANSTVIIMGDEGTGKEAIVNKFIYEGLENGDEAMYFTLDDSPEGVEEDAEYYGWDFSEYDDNIVFVDGYSWQAGGSDSKFALEGLSDLNQMNMTFTDALNELGDDEKRVAMDSASTLLLYTDATSAVKFLQVVGAKSAGSGGCLLITLEEGMHDDQTISTVSHVADGVIKLRVDGDQNQISVERMDKTDHTRDWKDFEVDGDAGEVNIDT
ncbi:MAG: RAD55 family ATPase [Candidatus Nanohaloarchaea archaeon]